MRMNMHGVPIGEKKRKDGHQEGEALPIKKKNGKNCDRNPSKLCPHTLFLSVQ